MMNDECRMEESNTGDEGRETILRVMSCLVLSNFEPFVYFVADSIFTVIFGI